MSPAPPAAPPRRWLARLVGTLALAVLLAAGALYGYQRTLIFLPTRLSASEFASAVSAHAREGARLLAPFDAVVFDPPAGVAVRGTAVFFHGNQGLGLDRAAFLEPLFRDRGLRLVIAEYPGYGARPGAPSEQSLVEDGNRLYAEVARRYRDAPLLVVGESLGSGVAVQVAALQSRAGAARRPERLVLLVPFLSLAETVSRMYWHLPVRPFVRDEFDSAGQLAGYAGPVAILAAGRDAVVGAEQARELAALSRARGETIYVEVGDAEHERESIHLSEADVTRLLGAARGS